MEPLSRICINCGQRPICDNCIKEHNHGFSEKTTKTGKRKKNKFKLRTVSLAEKCVYDMYVI